jgi:hypothetical protein
LELYMKEERLLMAECHVRACDAFFPWEVSQNSANNA